MISCNQYDYIEIVCMYSYPVELTLKSGEVLMGKALDTQFNDDREECIKVEVGAENDQALVVLDSISSMRVCVDNPHVEFVTFES